MDLLQALEPWMIPIVVMVCVTLIVTVSVVGNIIKTSIKRKDRKHLSENKEFLDALRDFKENMDRRVSNLEKLAASETPAASTERKSRKQNQSAIELELGNESSKEENMNESSKLRNMLN